jgi:transposase
MVKLFELEIPPTQMAREVGISYPTALKAIYLIRRAIAQAHEDDGLAQSEVAQADEDAAMQQFESGERAFGLKDLQGVIQIIPLGAVSADLVLQEQPRFAKHASLIFTGAFREYDAVVLWLSRVSATANRRLASGKVSLNGLDAFWNFAKPRLSKFHKGSDQDLYYFLKELAFRYQYRNRELFDIVVNVVTRLMPNY